MNAATERTALVTGASSGIGHAMAERLASQGVHLAIAGPTAEPLERAAADWRQRHGVRVHVFAIDLCPPGAPAALVAALADAGVAIDYLVNNAGVGHWGAFRKMTAAQHLEVMQLDMQALTLLTHALLPQLIARRGRILNVASVAALQPGPWLAVYSAAKAYVLSLSEALSAELARYGVTVTALCPAPVNTPFMQRSRFEQALITRPALLLQADHVARIGVNAMLAGRRVVYAGAAGPLLAVVVRVFPRIVVLKGAQALLARWG